jgi:hypothetical protein
VKYYCADCFEEIGNCQPDCPEAAANGGRGLVHADDTECPPGCPHLQASRVVNGVFCLTCGKKLYD